MQQLNDLTKRTLAISSLSDYFSELNRLTCNSGPADYIFRGQADQSWNLSCSLARKLYPEDVNKRPGLEEFLNELTGTVTSGHDSYVTALDDDEFHPESDLDKLSCLQHNLHPTCFIDFTRNALVALFFACYDPDRADRDGSVYFVKVDVEQANFEYVVPNRQKNQISFFFSPSDPVFAKESDPVLLDIPYFRRYLWEPSTPEERTLSQQSVFLFGQPVISTNWPKPFQCISVPAEAKSGILADLDRFFDINLAMLFPDHNLYHKFLQELQPKERPSQLKKHVELLSQDAETAFLKGRYEISNSLYKSIFDLCNTDESKLAINNTELIFSIARNHRKLGNFQESLAGLESCFDDIANPAITTSEHNYDLLMDFVLTTMGLFWSEPSLPDGLKSNWPIMSDGDYLQNAIYIYQKLLNRHNDRVDAHVNLSQCLIRKKQFREAVSVLNKAVSSDLVSPEVYYNRGCAYAGMEQFASADKDFSAAIDCDGSFVPAYISRAKLFLRTKDCDSASPDVRAAVRLAPDRKDALLLLQQFNSQCGGFDS